MNSVLFAAEVDCWPNKNLSKSMVLYFDDIKDPLIITNIERNTCRTKTRT